MNLEYGVLGPIEVRADGQRLDVGGARQRRLLGALILAGGRPVGADRLIDVVWVGDPPARARNTLRTYIARARRVLEVDGEAPLLTDPVGWRLDRPVDALDSTRFESLLASARAMSADPMAALATLEEALSLWRDDAYVEFRDEDWCAGEAVRLDELRLAAEEERFDAMLGCGLYDDAIGELERFTDHHPLRDRSRAQHMVALYRAGRQVDAVRTYQDYRRYLLEEIGVEPSDELRSLEQRIIGRDPSLQQRAPDDRHLRGYRLGAVIGEGAFGRIYRASQPTLGREVAIKVVRPDLADNPEFIRRFDGEAKIIARLEHPHIVPLFDYWREPGGAFLVMRYLRGGSARQLIDSRGPMSLDRVTRVVEEVGSALAAAHRAGVTHRDVKPANILFDELGNAYLGDFGIALPADSTTPAAAQPATGSGAYVSPELASGGESTPRSDVYAFGATISELLTGEASTRQVALVPAGLPRDLDAVLRQATAADPDQRFGSVSELVVAFTSVTESVGVAPSSPIGWAARNPYKGLAAFDEADVRDFFGREDLIDQLHAAITDSRFLAVVGPSGSGKSSVVRAGLAPRLRADGTYVLAMMPGADPMDRLTQALLELAPASQAAALPLTIASSGDGLLRAVRQCLPDVPGDVVLIVDQFEELFTMAADADRRRFLGALSGAVGDQQTRLRVVVTIRADYFDQPLSDDLISGLVRANTVAVTPLGPADLELAISAPAIQVGVTVEPALVAALVADAATASMSLPLIQYELTSLFDQCDGHTLTLAAYDRQGGLGTAVARRAEEIFQGHDGAGRDDVRRLFGRLVTPGDRGEATRRRARLSELPSVTSTLVDAYAQARLLTLDRDQLTREPTVEIAHEALIHQWPRLHGWVEADRDSLRMLGHLTESAASWEAAGHDAGELYRGGRLDAAEEWAATHPEQLNAIEQAFLDASISARDSGRARERHRARRLALLAATLAVVAAVAIGAGLVALRQRDAADANAAEAEQRALENKTAQLVGQSSLALVGSDPDLAILLALAAHDVSTEISDAPQPGVVAALHEAVQGSRLERIIDGGYSVVAVSPDGEYVAVDHVDVKNRLAIYDIETGELAAERVLDDNVGGLAYSPDGSLLAVSFCCTERDRPAELPAVLLVDPMSLHTEQTLPGGERSWRPGWSTDGQQLLANGESGPRIWDVSTGELALEVPGDDRTNAAFTLGSTSLVVADSGTLDVVDSNTGERNRRSEIPFEVRAMATSPSGEHVAYIDRAAELVVVVRLATGETVASVAFPGPEKITFSPDGTSLAIGGNHDAVRVIDLDGGEVIELRGHGTGVWSSAYTPDGRLAVASRDGGTRVWNLTPAGPSDLGNLTIEGRARGGQAKGDTEMLVSVQTGPEEGHLVGLDLATGARRPIADFWFGQFQWPVFSPDGRFVTGFSDVDHLPSVLDVDTGRVVTSLRPCETPRGIDAINGWVLVDFDPFECPPGSPYEEKVGRTGFVDLATGELIAPAGAGKVFEAVIGPPGSVGADLVAYQTDAGIVFRRASSLEALTEWARPAGMITLASAFAPDGSALGVSAQTREAVIFDVEAILAGASASEAVTVFPELHTGPTQRVVPLGDSIVTTGSGTQVRQWDTTSGSLLVDVSTDLGFFVQLLVTTDGASLFYADADGILRRYLADSDELVELARSRVQRDFTEAECLLYFGADPCRTQLKDGPAKPRTS